MVPVAPTMEYYPKVLLAKEIKFWLVFSSKTETAIDIIWGSFSGAKKSGLYLNPLKKEHGRVSVFRWWL